MRVFRKYSLTVVLATVAVLSCAAFAFGEDPKSTDRATRTRIKNFGCINENYFRGAQPSQADYADLAAMGIRTVIDLQREGDPKEEGLVLAAGLKFFRIPMSDKDRPEVEKVDQFLRLVNDPANQPVFVHCKGGRHRTGLMTAAYRMMRYGWNAEQAFEEMKKFDFNYGFGHGDLKDFVFDYYKANEEKVAAAAEAGRK